MAQLRNADERLAQIESSLGETRERMNERDAELYRAIGESRDAVLSVLPPAAASAVRFPQLVRSVVPTGATVLVVSKGDDALLQLGDRCAWHFPRRDDGEYAGYHPESAGAAIVHLEALRAKGADFLVFPASALWWLQHYSDLKRHLERRYQLITRQDETGAIYDLRPVTSDRSAAPH